MARRQMTTREFQEWIEAFRSAGPEIQRAAIRIILDIWEKPQINDVEVSQAARMTGGPRNG
jgi:hypothetical protein